VRARKPIRAIAADAVPRVFDGECIVRIARLGRLPGTADVNRFAHGVRWAARIYAADARASTAKELRAEIAKLYGAASRRQYERVAELLEAISSEARDRLISRERSDHADTVMPSERLRVSGRDGEMLTRHWSEVRSPLTLPTADAFHDAAGRDAACAAVASLTSWGGLRTRGRKRLSGKRSVTWAPFLNAPEFHASNKRKQRSPKRAAELRFVQNLRLAWLEAEGGDLPVTVNPYNSDLPFPKMVRYCLKLVGAPDASAIRLINELSKRRSRRPPVSP
jgi:hypothetical protein